MCIIGECIPSVGSAEILPGGADENPGCSYCEGWSLIG